MRKVGDIIAAIDAAAEKTGDFTECIREVVWTADSGGPAPLPEYERGMCPDCGEPIVSSCYYVKGALADKYEGGLSGYVVRYECYGNVRTPGSCTYKSKGDSL
jgi:hypothetical protein